MAEPVSVSNSDIIEGLARKKPFKILILKIVRLPVRMSNEPTYYV